LRSVSETAHHGRCESGSVAAQRVIACTTESAALEQVTPGRPTRRCPLPVGRRLAPAPSRGRSSARDARSRREGRGRCGYDPFAGRILASAIPLPGTGERLRDGRGGQGERCRKRSLRIRSARGRRGGDASAPPAGPPSRPARLERASCGNGRGRRAGGWRGIPSRVSSGRCRRRQSGGEGRCDSNRRALSRAASYLCGPAADGWSSTGLAGTKPRGRIVGVPHPLLIKRNRREKARCPTKLAEGGAPGG
jgi:hypothetical protein